MPSTRNGEIAATDSGVRWEFGGEQVRLDAWGQDGIRVRAGVLGKLTDSLWALERDLLEQRPGIVDEDHGAVENGRLRATIDRQGTIRFYDLQHNGDVLLEEVVSPRGYVEHPRQYLHQGGERVRASAHFRARSDERFYGLGQHQHGLLDQKGAIVELEQRNTEVTVPFLVSSRGYGFLWNNPAKGRAELGTTRTSWIAERTYQIDYLVFGGPDPSSILERYTEATGRPPMMPDYAAGFWQCKLRYSSQEELLSVAREHKGRGLPLSVIVIDYFHWTKMGEWRFDPAAWPDPDAMVRELADMGAEVMVSVWPTVNADSEYFPHLRDRNLLLTTERGLSTLVDFHDAYSDGTTHLHYYDPSSAEAREFIWKRIREGYYDHGIRIFWLDACEPEIRPQHLDNIRMNIGNMEEVGCTYPLFHQKAFYDGMREAGQQQVLNLCRSAWAGSQRYGAAVWSGDVDSSFEALQTQIPAGLNMALSGIPWWTTDIGGFHGGNSEDPEFRELVIRWFQYALFCPIMRLHGYREPTDAKHGSPNEVWSFGDEAYEIICRLLFIRERIRPYVLEQMRCASETGLPPMRPLFVDFPEDGATWEIDDQFMFGPDILVAPVLHYRQRTRRLYLPEGARWLWGWDRSWSHDGGAHIEVDAPLETIPVFLREGSELVLA